MLVVVVLLTIVSAVKKHIQRFEVLFTYDVDFAFYEMARALFEAKDTLYDYENTLEILYHDKKRIFTKPVLTYKQQFPKIQENIDYLEKLLQKKIFTNTFHTKLTQNYQILQKIGTIYSFIHTILTFLTL